VRLYGNRHSGKFQPARSASVSADVRQKPAFSVQNTAFGLKNGFLTANNLRPVPEQHRSVRRNKAGICREQANRGVLLAQTQAICG
jgi:hypothetical protein